MKKIISIVLCIILIFMMSGCQSTPSTTPTDNDQETGDLSNSTSPDGTGGDENACKVHSFYYHAISGDWSGEQINAFIKYYEENKLPEEKFNIVEFVQFHKITREEYIKMAGWENLPTWEGDLDKPALAHHKNCPYTYNQFLDAIYGDDAELAEWVFASESTYSEKSDDSVAAE